MEGLLFKYGPASANTAFMTARHHRRHVIMIGGLTDGLLVCRWVPELAAQLEQRSWSLVQPLLSSSYTGWGVASLDQDAEELHELAKHLKSEYGSKGIVLVGHSTGCQDVVRYAQRFRQLEQAPPLLGAVLQAPVSDREYLATLPGTAAALARAEEMLAKGEGEEVALRAHDLGGAAVTARRWHALAAVGGDDDMFSSDLSEQRLREIFAPLRGLPMLVMLSGADEYVAPHVDQAELGQRIAAAAGEGARWQVVQGGLHGLENRVPEACHAIAGFVSCLEQVPQCM